MERDDTIALWATWQQAAANPSIDSAIRDLYQRIDAAIASRGPTCWQSGKCCKFDSYGHLLYVTGLEIAWFVGHAPGPAPGSGLGVSGTTGDGHKASSLPILTTHTAPASPASHARAQQPDACPYQIEGLCSTHTIRPLGCRIYFCQEGTQDWQHQLYEDFLAELRQLHDAHGLDYRYMEWRAGLTEAQAILTGDG